VRERLAAAGLRPQRRLGQNFLCHQGILTAVADAAELTPEDSVLEVGAGLGALTAELAARAGRVVAVELDRALFGLLAATPELRSGAVQLVSGDILRLTDDELLLPAGGGPFKVVANIPYYLTSPLIERVLERWPQCLLAVLMVQEEVARRLVAKPGGREYGSMTVFVGYYACVELVRVVPASAFWPRPDVRSAVVRLRRRTAAPFAVDPAAFFSVVHAAFGQRRKQIRNSLGGPPLGLLAHEIEPALERAGIDGARRAEELSLLEFGRLAAAVRP
jgi:16S rRNA (adenine1518-N6/adenine1519-N6)-dimethyltransferase